MIKEFLIILTQRQFVLNYTNRTVPCEINASTGSSFSSCMTGFPLYAKFDNGYYYASTTRWKKEKYHIGIPKMKNLTKKVIEL
jgi:hypothetical protein